MNPAYDNSVPFHPTIPNQNPINTFFPSQVQHNGQYPSDSYSPHFPNAGYSNPPQLNVPYPSSYGYNSNRSVFFPPPNHRSVYPNLGINPRVATPYSNNHNMVNPGYYPGPCICGHHHPVNSQHVPPYSRLRPIGDFIYQVRPTNNSTQFNPPNPNWPRNQNNIYYPPANQVPGNSTATNWNYHPSLNQNPPSYTPSYPPSQNYHAASGNNSSWIPYANRNTFQPIPNNYNLSEYSFEPLSSDSELNLLGSSPDRPACNHNSASPIGPVPSAEVCGNHTDTNQNSANVINGPESQTAGVTVSTLEEPIRYDVQYEPIPASSLTDADVSDGDLIICETQSANSDRDKSDSTISVGQCSNNITGITVSTNAMNGTETVLESNDHGLKNVPKPSVVYVEVQNIEASAKNQTLDDSIAQAEMNTTPNHRETIVNPATISQNVNDCPTIVHAKECQHLTNNTDNPNTSSQPKPQVEQPSFDATNAKSNCEKFSRNRASVYEKLSTQISANFRQLLIRYLNRLDNVLITTDRHTVYVSIEDDIINSFIASLSAENRRLLLQNTNISTENPPEASENVCNEREENVGNLEKKEANQTVDTEAKLAHNQENIDNTSKNEAGQIADAEPELTQCNVLLESCADQEEILVNVDDSSESPQHLNVNESADDIDVINTNLDTIEVTVGDTCNDSIDEAFLENVPLDLAKEKSIAEAQTGAKTRYFEVSQFLPKGNLYWQYFDAPSLQDNTPVYGSSANDMDEHSVDVLVELPLNLTCKKQSKTTESQTEDIGSKYPELSLLLTSQAIESSVNSGTKATANGVASKQQEFSLMDSIIFLSKHLPDSSEPPMKKVRVKDPKILRKNDEPKR